MLLERIVEELFIWEEEEEENEGESSETPESPSGEEDIPETPDVDDVFDDSEEAEEPLGEKGVSALKKLRNEQKRLKQQLNKYKGIDLEEYQKIQEDKKKTEEQRLRDQRQWQTLSKRQETTIKQLNEDIGKRDAAIKQLTKETELKDYYYASQGLQGRSSVDGRSYFDHVKSAIAARTRREADGSYTVLDLEGFDQKNDAGKPMTMAELLDELRDDPFYGHYFAARPKAGSGITPGGKGKVEDDNSRDARWSRLKRKTGYVGKR